jgi:hypothetical protein
VLDVGFWEKLPFEAQLTKVAFWSVAAGRPDGVEVEFLPAYSKGFEMSAFGQTGRAVYTPRARHKRTHQTDEDC